MTTRGRDWRRLQRFFKGKHSCKSNEWKPEKNWKLLYLRSVKLHRAKKLGREYPQKTLRQLLERDE